MTEPTPPTPSTPPPPMPGPQGFPGPPVSAGEPVDPDASGLPPEARLPDAACYRRDQWFARLMVCIAGLLVLMWMTWATDEHHNVYLICTLAVGAATFYSGFRFALAQRSVRHKPSDRS